MNSKERKKELDVDFIGGEELSLKERKQISAYIREQKLKRQRRKKVGSPSKVVPT